MTENQQAPSDETQNTENQPTDAAEEQQAYRSQEEVDKAIQSRLARERKKWEKEAAERAEAERKKAQMDEAEKAQAEKEEAEKRASDRERVANERVIRSEAKVQALEAGTKPERVSALLRLSDLSDIEVDDEGEPDAKAVRAAIDAALKEYPEFKSTHRVGGNGSNPPDDESGEVTQDQFNKMNYAQRVELFNRDRDIFERISG